MSNLSSVTSTTSASNISDCNIYVKYRKSSGTFFGLHEYGFQGIPQNFVLNVIGWIIMILIFSILRKKAWNYGRIALFERNDTIYVQTNVITVNNDPSDSSEASDEELDAATDNEEDLELESPESQSPITPLQTCDEIPTNRTPYESELLDEGLFNWIKVVLTLTDEQYLEKSGIDCVQYLSFQRHLIFLATIITFSSLAIILPINFQGGKSDTEGNISDFKFFHTTILNVNKNNPNFLWVHTIMAVSFFLLGIAVMRHFYASLKEEDNSAVYSSLMITNLSRNICHEEMIREHFSEAYPDALITEVNFAYDISDLKDMEFQRLGAASAKKYWLNYFNDKNVRPVMRPFICGTVCFCCGKLGCKETDAIDFYTSQEILFSKEERAERKKALTKPLGIVFLTFSVPNKAAKIMRDYRFLPKCLRMTPVSKLTTKLNSRYWSVNYAPLPEDLYWENLAYSPIYWYMKIVIINVILLIVICFYTTPVFLLNKIPVTQISEGSSHYDKYDYSTSAFVGLLMDTLPTFLLWIFAVTLPSLVSVSDRFVQFWTKTAENRSKMIKIYSYLILMVIILPALGLTSIAVVLGFGGQNDQQKKPRIECVFSVENGALFVNYLCTSTFLGTASELMRIPELIVYVVKICLSRSPAENPSIRQSVLWEFQLGSQYAWMMLNFTMFTLFSLIFPLISPFGMVYIIFKHYVDRYNIYFAYGRTKVAKEVHTTAINFLIVCMFLLQPTIVSIQGLSVQDETSPDDTQWLRVFSVIALCLTAAVFIGQVFFSMVVGTSLKPYYGILKQKADAANITSSNIDIAELGESESQIVQTETHGETRITMGRYFPRILRPEKANHNYFPSEPVTIHGSSKHSGARNGSTHLETITTEVIVETAGTSPPTSEDIVDEVDTTPPHSDSATRPNGVNFTPEKSDPSTTNIER